jgi:catechol 2,3-dioxygenase-like lactoylglutathione lyase family enzyme
MGPPTETIVETALYADDLAVMKAFYVEVIGLKLLGEDLARHVFFQVGPASVLLIFNPATTREKGDFSSHGTTGAGHVAFGIAAMQVDAWRDHLRSHSLAIEQETTWPRGGQSLYFRDPANHLVELVTRGVWGTTAGW